MIWLLLLLVSCSTKRLQVGDTFKLKISINSVDEEEIKESLDDFHLSSLTKDGTFYLVELQPLKPGKQELMLGNTKIVVDVESILSSMNEEEIQKKLYKTTLPIIDKSYHWSLYLVLFGIVLSLLLVLYYRYRKSAHMKHYHWLLEQLKDKELDREDLFQITFYLKEYLHGKFDIVLGSGSSELVDQIPFGDELKTILDRIDPSKYSLHFNKTGDIIVELKDLLDKWEVKDV